MATSAKSTAESVSKVMPPDSNAPPGPNSRPTKPKPNVRIQMLPPTAAEESVIVSELCNIVNRVYVETEGDLFVDGYQRIDADEMRQAIRAGELAVANVVAEPSSDSSNLLISDKSEQELNGVAVGCLRMRRLSGPDSQTGGLGMFAIDAAYRGGGLGRDMVAFMESHGRSVLGLTTMRLELLVPLWSEHAFKKRLLEWYTRMGYRMIKLGVFQQDYPQIAALLRGPTDYRVFEKSLVS